MRLQGAFGSRPASPGISRRCRTRPCRAGSSWPRASLGARNYRAAAAYAAEVLAVDTGNAEARQDSRRGADDARALRRGDRRCAPAARGRRYPGRGALARNRARPRSHVAEPSSSCRRGWRRWRASARAAARPGGRQPGRCAATTARQHAGAASAAASAAAVTRPAPAPSIRRPGAGTSARAAGGRRRCPRRRPPPAPTDTAARRQPRLVPPATPEIDRRPSAEARPRPAAPATPVVDDDAAIRRLTSHLRAGDRDQGPGALPIDQAEPVARRRAPAAGRLPRGDVAARERDRGLDRSSRRRSRPSCCGGAM